MSSLSRTRLNPDELRSIGIELFGQEPGWQSRMAEALGYDRSSVTRWLSGAVPMPQHASLLLRYIRKFGPPDEAL